MRICIFENIVKKVESRWKLALPGKCYGKLFERSKTIRKKNSIFPYYVRSVQFYTFEWAVSKRIYVSAVESPIALQVRTGVC